MNVLKSLAICLVSCAVPASALAQGGPPTFHYVAAEAPLEAGAIRLPMDRVATDRRETWFLNNNMLTVRNVVQPTLTPVLPAGPSTGAAIIIAPGGGFNSLSMENEGWRIARWLANHGIAAFVLKYRLVATPAELPVYQDEFNRMIRGEKVSFSTPATTPPEALADGLAALRHVRANAPEYRIDPKRIGFMGFSAGGFLTRSIIENAGADMPAFAAPIYPRMGPMLNMPDNAPPMFVLIAADDFLMPPPGEGFGLIESWRAAKKPIEFHLLANGGHGFGYGRPGTASEGWLTLFYNWMTVSGFLKAAS